MSELPCICLREVTASLGHPTRDAAVLYPKRYGFSAFMALVCVAPNTTNDDAATPAAWAPTPRNAQRAGLVFWQRNTSTFEDNNGNHLESQQPQPNLPRSSLRPPTITRGK